MYNLDWMSTNNHPTAFQGSAWFCIEDLLGCSDESSLCKVMGIQKWCQAPSHPSLPPFSIRGSCCRVFWPWTCRLKATQSSTRMLPGEWREEEPLEEEWGERLRCEYIQCSVNGFTAKLKIVFEFCWGKNVCRFISTTILRTLYYSYYSSRHTPCGDNLPVRCCKTLQNKIIQHNSI